VGFRKPERGVVRCEKVKWLSSIALYIVCMLFESFVFHRLFENGESVVVPFNLNSDISDMTCVFYGPCCLSSQCRQAWTRWGFLGDGNCVSQSILILHKCSVLFLLDKCGMIYN
jgi:hypothetical protein